MQTLKVLAEHKEILHQYYKLRRAIDPILRPGDSEMIRESFRLAAKAHFGVRRKSGEPYILHPIAVAQIVVEEINLGPTAVAAALLHDVVEDTSWTIEDIQERFGSKVAKIVDGVTKIKVSGKYDVKLGISEQAENFRRMILTISDDVRVIMVKLADRLHNMRTLASMKRDKQLKIASETIFIYAPLAHRLGLYKIKTELEDLYLKYSQRDIYRGIADKLNKTKAQRNKFISEFIGPLNEALFGAGFYARVFGRPKSIYSIWNKMQRQNVPFEKIYDLFAIRIVIQSPEEHEKADCWRVYSLVTDFYKPNPDRLRDWISTPKTNGYESLHTTVMGPEGKWVEVQIRTERMDEIAEKGYAAHWKYKEKRKKGKSKRQDQSESGLDTWVRTIRELREQDQSLSATEFINAFRSNFLQEEIFVFTPKGDLKSLPNGSSVLDFAFSIHTEIGLSCLGAKVNQKMVPLSYKLRNGDQIEIVTSPQAKPNADWLKLVVTTRASSKIKDYIRYERKESILLGKEVVQKRFKQYKFEYNDENLNQLKGFLQIKHLSDLFYDVGQGYVKSKRLNDFRDWKNRREKQHTFNRNKENALPKPSPSPDLDKLQQVPKSEALVIGDESALQYTLASCCKPMPGDDVFGFITIHDGIKIHRTDCPNSVSLMSQYGYRIIKAVWKSQKEQFFQVELKIVGNDRIGLVRDVTQFISGDMKVNISAIDVGITDEGIFEGKIKLFVRNKQHLQTLLDEIRDIDGVESISRVDSE